MQNTGPLHDDKNNKLSIKNIAVSFAIVAITTNAVIDLFSKGKAYYTENHIQSYVPDGTTQIQIDNQANFESIFTSSIDDIIKRKGGYDTIPDIISYKKSGVIETINVGSYIENLDKMDIGLLNTRGNSEVSHATGLIHYIQKDFQIHQCLFEDLSSKWINILAEDSYRDKVAKIQKFVRSLGYERDLIYLGDNQDLPALSNYQLPSLANLMIGKMDCNNKTGLFIQLCRANDILVGIGSSLTHMTPVVYSHKDDAMWKLIKANTSVGYVYNGIVVDPTSTDITNGVRRPAIAGDMIGDPYEGMKFVFAKAPL